MKRLNLGCGANYHPDWVNADIDPLGPDVIKIDVTRRLPFQNETFDVVYHSHLLEHFDVEAGQVLLRECFRVLKPGGVLRVVVPDFERIAEIYLVCLDRARKREEGAELDYDWIMLEAIDQISRSKKGGLMAPMLKGSLLNRAFVESRVGKAQISEVGGVGRRRSLPARLKRLKVLWLENLVKLITCVLLGKSAGRGVNEGLFRAKGEVHRWMYDQYSLARALSLAGFESPRRVGHLESAIQNFEAFGLDGDSGGARKPDSLFMEAHRPVSGGGLRGEVVQ